MFRETSMIMASSGRKNSTTSNVSSHTPPPPPSHFSSSSGHSSKMRFQSHIQPIPNPRRGRAHLRSQKSPPTVSDFERKLVEADAYLQILIDQVKNLDQKITDSSDDTASLVNIKAKTLALLDGVKHTIALLQIAKNTVIPVNGILSATSANLSIPSEDTTVDTKRPLRSTSTPDLNKSSLPQQGEKQRIKEHLEPRNDLRRQQLLENQSSLLPPQPSLPVNCSSANENSLINPTTATTDKSTALTTTVASVKSESYSTPQLLYLERRRSDGSLSNPSDPQLTLEPDVTFSDESDDEFYYDAREDDATHSLNQALVESLITATATPTAISSGDYSYEKTSRRRSSGSRPQSASSFRVAQVKLGTDHTMTSLNSPIDAGNMPLYVKNQEAEEFGSVGDQTEEVADENKSLLWSLLKQLRPGMDLSKVVLPTFILEPRSFLEKLSDYYYHVDILSQAGKHDDPFQRMKLVTQWYLSGFYKKPKGLKKPYNPIIGETFRCFWYHPDTDSRTFYIAEQVSHHPPISAFYVANKKAGFCIHGSILAKSKFYGNSVSALLEGTAHLTLLDREEEYTLTMPYAHCKGILVGTLSLELGGKVEIHCEKTGYTTDIEFKLKPFLGGQDYCNLVVGKIRLGKETLATFEGHWDTEIYIKNKLTGQSSPLWVVTSDVKARRLQRYSIPIARQQEFESERLWQRVSIAIKSGDQIAATEEKTILEDAQRRATADLKMKGKKWTPKHFVQDVYTGGWVYKHIDKRPWDPKVDVVQFEHEYVIQSKQRSLSAVSRKISNTTHPESTSPGKGGTVDSTESLPHSAVDSHNSHSVSTSNGSVKSQVRTKKEDEIDNVIKDDDHTSGKEEP